MSEHKNVPVRLGERRPGEAYILAQDNEPRYSGPPWCPFNLWTAVEDEGRGLVSEAARKLVYSPGARELWAAIGSHYERADSIALMLPMWCAEIQAHWKATPKMTPAEFRADRKELKRMAERLAHELDHFFDRWDEAGTTPAADTEGGGIINFTQLLSKEEQQRMWDSLDYDTWELIIGDDRGNPGIVPNLPSILRRIGRLFEDEARWPPLERPKGENAERNYFCRRLIAFFRNSGKPSPRIIAAVVSIFFPQGITENEVSQQMARLPSGRPLPPGSV